MVDSSLPFVSDRIVEEEQDRDGTCCWNGSFVKAAADPARKVMNIVLLHEKRQICRVSRPDRTFEVRGEHGIFVHN